MFRRGKIYYSEHNTTGQQGSLQTNMHASQFELVYHGTFDSLANYAQQGLRCTDQTIAYGSYWTHCPKSFLQ